MKRTAQLAQLYLVVVAIAGIIFFALHLGSQLAPPRATTSAKVEMASHPAPAHDSLFKALVTAVLVENARGALSRLILQLILIIVVASVVGSIFTRLRQPAVVGEMVAGILLGPSLFGLLAPNAFQFVFATPTLGALKLFSQIGVCLFLFVVGMELNVSHLRKKAEAAVVVSHASIVVPYLLGVILAFFVYSQLAQPGISFTAFALFMGISTSITAFPVLVRILQDRGIFKTPLGSTATTCAAVDDVTAWSILAFVVAIAGATSTGGAVASVLLVLAFVALMLLVIKPSLPRWIGQFALERPNPSKMVLAIVITVALISAWITETIGIHALFGAFLAGIVIPQVAGFRDKLVLRVESITGVLLLPLFFAFTGLRTHIGLLNTAQDWLICLVIIGVATAGKLGGSAVAARLTGMPWRESLQLGALMNTRGLMELIALNIGYDMGILSQRIFTMLVIMALVTTIMTGPLLSLLTRKEEVEEPLNTQPILSRT
jgi:Kef-type K+ transport system membrane component KefB